MIVDNGKYYLYRHIRLDKNEPFYIGVGTKPTKSYPSTEYARAYCSHNKRRNNIWKKISSKIEFEIEILIESNSKEFILEKEKEFIELYGRIDKKTGILANLTDGGDGAVGCIASEDTKRKISLSNFFKGKFGKEHPRAKKVYQYDLDGNFIKEWDSLMDIRRYFNTKECPDKCLRGKSNSYKGFLWFYNYQGVKTLSYNTNYFHCQRKRVGIPVYQYRLDGSFLKKWECMLDIQNELGIRTARISDFVRTRHFYKNTGYWFLEDMGIKINPLNYPNTKGKRNDL